MIKARLEENMSSESASICYAVLFGDQSEIPDDVKDAYRESGIIHILTVSGLHVGFLIGILFFANENFSRHGKYINFSYLFYCAFGLLFLVWFHSICRQIGIDGHNHASCQNEWQKIMTT